MNKSKFNEGDVVMPRPEIQTLESLKQQFTIVRKNYFIPGGKWSYFCTPFCYFWEDDIELSNTSPKACYHTNDIKCEKCGAHCEQVTIQKDAKTPIYIINDKNLFNTTTTMLPVELHNFRKSLSFLIQECDRALADYGRGNGAREMALVKTKLEEAKMWAGKVLEAQGEKLPPQFADNADNAV